MRATTDDVHQLTNKTNDRFFGQIQKYKSFTTVALIILLIGTIGLGYYFLLPGKGISRLDNKKSIAILPFANVSQDANIEYLSNGITENVINNLSQISSLRGVGKEFGFPIQG